MEENPALVDRWIFPITYRVSTILLVVYRISQHPQYGGLKRLKQVTGIDGVLIFSVKPTQEVFCQEWGGQTVKTK